VFRNQSTWDIHGEKEYAMDMNERLNALFREACEIAEGEEIRDEWEPGLRAEWDSLANLTLSAFWRSNSTPPW
jgi:hypothetical protein